MLSKLQQLFIIGIGGALGTLLRYAFNQSLIAFTNYPIATIVENIVGTFLLGILAGWLSKRTLKTQWINDGFGVGFCGGFTTMSTFAADTVLLANTTSVLASTGYFIATFVGGAVAIIAGFELGSYLVNRGTSDDITSDGTSL